MAKITVKLEVRCTQKRSTIVDFYALRQRARFRAHAWKPADLARQGRGTCTGEEVRCQCVAHRALGGRYLRFATQIQIAADAAKFGVARLAGVEAPKFEDNEGSIAELKERVRKTVEFVQSVPAAQIDGSENKDIIIPRRDGSMVLKGEIFLKHFSLPNFFFHVTTTYALLRHNGVELGKVDYLGALQ